MLQDHMKIIEDDGPGAAFYASAKAMTNGNHTFYGPLKQQPQWIRHIKYITSSASWEKILLSGFRGCCTQLLMKGFAGVATKIHAKSSMVAGEAVSNICVIVAFNVQSKKCIWFNYCKQ
ncbi:uncharacterized protein [Zea mays]|uniref:uncharacterized protein isoform X2 n=1 Tax=Zea mays TaxID=4577 RepID=UPI0004DEBBBA|nr:uncharacterized protein LOC103643894 isoform X2 [Zea mays]XP_020402485.1 uncharacterized protein LOC103643894 isoform X2 [Zea mays]|eukprot:XP_008665287.1 uncharacterized protein LOC103643894 isoform X2 [Zea mays]